MWREKRKVRIFGKGKCKLIVNCANFGKRKCKLIANFSATMVTSLPSVSLSLSLYLSLSLPHRAHLTHNIGRASALPIIQREKNLLICSGKKFSYPTTPHDIGMWFFIAVTPKHRQNRPLQTYRTYPLDARLEWDWTGGKVLRAKTQNFPCRWENHECIEWTTAAQARQDNLRKNPLASSAVKHFSPLLPCTKNTVFVSFTAFSQRKLFLSEQKESMDWLSPPTMSTPWRPCGSCSLPGFHKCCRRVEPELEALLPDEMRIFRRDTNQPPSSSLACWQQWYRRCFRQSRLNSLLHCGIIGSAEALPILCVRYFRWERERERYRERERDGSDVTIVAPKLAMNTLSLAKNSHNWRWAYTFPCQKFALFVSPFTLPVSPFTERSPLWRWNSQWVHTFHCQNFFRPLCSPSFKWHEPHDEWSKTQDKWSNPAQSYFVLPIEKLNQINTKNYWK